MNCHGINNLLRNIHPSEFQQHTLSFFSETWSTNPTPFLRNKDFYFVPAIKGPRGRPKGGLEVYVNASYNSQELSCSSQHIAITFLNRTFICCYYQPGTDLDDILIDLAILLSKASDQSLITISGDLNLSPTNPDFIELVNFLQSAYNIHIQSDTSHPTFIGHQGTSCIDHSFSTPDMKVISVKTISAAYSDHLPLQMLSKIPIKSNHTNIKLLKQKPIDFDVCISRLKSVDLNQNPITIVENIDKILLRY